MIVLFITVSLKATILVVCSVSLVNIQMVAVTQVWGLSFNLMTAINMTFALGVAVDYSSHIAHTYLSVKAPSSLQSDSSRRDYKARKAISQMGSSVAHGACSTLICVLVLGLAKVYTVVVFFKCWVCLVTFGFLNGIVLLPVLLSLVGPLEENLGKRKGRANLEAEYQMAQLSNGKNSQKTSIGIEH